MAAGATGSTGAASFRKTARRAARVGAPGLGSGTGSGAGAADGSLREGTGIEGVAGGVALIAGGRDLLLYHSTQPPTTTTSKQRATKRTRRCMSERRSGEILTRGVWCRAGTSVYPNLRPAVSASAIPPRTTIADSTSRIE